MTPKALQDAPDLAPRWHYSYKVYRELDGSRPPAFSGLSRIPISEFMHYANLYGFSRLEAQNIWQDVALIDQIRGAEFARKAKLQQKGT